MSVEEIFEELNEELEGLPGVIGMSKLFLKLWDLLNQNYDELTATRKINAIASDVAGLPIPVAVARLVNYYVNLRLGYDPFSKVD